ncbi:MAG TPA: ADP-dependent glucokinase/phosphofructokinase, partial [bacterium]|nr:ADP-dependent glucokinase/phosphofructokinase [bacterium]
EEGPRKVAAPVDVLRGFVDCFRRGSAQEWVVTNAGAYEWMRKYLGYDRLQMGGQGGIAANVMAVAGVPRVYVHCASLPGEQAGLFVGHANLLSTDRFGDLQPVASIQRPDDPPMVHWILEFDQGDELTLGSVILRAPKANRFIATYDPLNMALHVDEGFDRAMGRASHPLEVILLSGYQLLSATLPGQEPGSGLRRIDQTWSQVQAWRDAHPGCVVHFEWASTQDAEVVRHLAGTVGKDADSVGCNEQELIALLETLGEKALAKGCAGLGAVALFKGLRRVFDRLKLKRIQLHMYGLYMTLLRPGSEALGPAFQPQANRDGMVLAATLAASKAGTGNLDDASQLLWAHGREVADQGLAELSALAEQLEPGGGASSLAVDGMFKGRDFNLVAVPTILVEPPLSLVGLGDTISSLSLVGAR